MVRDLLGKAMEDGADRPALLTAAEAAAQLRIHRTTLYRLVKAGTAPVMPRRVGSQLRWSRAEVEQWLADGGHNGERRH
jgi:excisionase family DNA binding protein